MLSCSRLCGAVIAVSLAAAVLIFGVCSAHAQTPAVSLAPETTAVVSFPETAVGSAAASQNVLLAINSSLTISSISVPKSQGGVQEFTVGPITGCVVDGVTTNSAGSTCTVPVTFQPSYPGLRQMPLVVQTSAGTFQFGLEGIGQGPQPALLPGVISTVAGGGSGCAGQTDSIGDGCAATGAVLVEPAAIAVDSAGNLYIADLGNQRIRKVSAASGAITTVAGTGAQGYSGDNVPATSAELDDPDGVAVDSAGNLYIADGGNNLIRKVSANTGRITTVAGNGSNGSSGDGGPATSAGVGSMQGVAVDSAGNLYIADYGNSLIRKVSAATGVITTVAGSETGKGCQGGHQGGGTGDGGPATRAVLNCPGAVAMDSAAGLYIEDNYERIRTVSATTPPLSFPPTQINSNSAAQTFTVANIGNAPLNLSGITASTSFNVDGSTTTCSTSSPLAVGDSCVVGVVFSPTTGGSLNGTLTLTDNALNVAGSTQQVNLSGSGETTMATAVNFQPITPASPNYGQAINITVNVVSQSGPGIPSTGSVTFTVDGIAQPAAPLGSNGAVGLQLSGLSAGLH